MELEVIWSGATWRDYEQPTVAALAVAPASGVPLDRSILDALAQSDRAQPVSILASLCKARSCATAQALSRLMDVGLVTWEPSRHPVTHRRTRAFRLVPR